jgi:beta-aspartyl-dipeptidase (metallo-type)
MKLLTNVNCYCPQPVGKKDILIAGSTIEKIVNPGELSALPGFTEIIQCEDCNAFPGIIDQHVHIIGGGGEGGPQSSIVEIAFKDIIEAGVTTVVGLLGMDSHTKSLVQLYTKARSLQMQGITTFIYTGSYAVPAPTLTNNIIDDLILIDKVIGCGEVALSDHRSTHASMEALMQLASGTHIGGLLGCKAGVVHIHMGDGKDGLDPLLSLLDKTDLPMEQFVPTHVNRSECLFHQAMKYWKSGGTIDLTAGEQAGIPVPEALRMLAAKDSGLPRVTVSSDANGSIPAGGIAQIQTLYDDIKDCMINAQVPPETVIRCATENVARVLKLYPVKGSLAEGSDADVLITDQQFNLIKLFCRGNMVLNNSAAVGFAP